MCRDFLKDRGSIRRCLALHVAQGGYHLHQINSLSFEFFKVPQHRRIFPVGMR